MSGCAITDAGSEPFVHSTATVRLTYQRLPIRRAGRTSGMRRRIFWQFELAEPFLPTFPNQSRATCSNRQEQPRGQFGLCRRCCARRRAHRTDPLLTGVPTCIFGCEPLLRIMFAPLDSPHTSISWGQY